MRPLRYSINVTFDGCCEHREMIADEDLHRNALENIGQGADVVRGQSKRIDLKLVSRLEFGSGAVAMRYEP
ncbi:MAG: deaminase, partial [Gemmatimonadota bacterium]|nr:deaminase [Gemmatimonadota bacterium]